jgi:hypothetical protein
MMETLKTVLWGFAGIRRKSEAERPIKPVHIIIAAILFVVLFIFTLRTIVSIVVS